MSQPNFFAELKRRNVYKVAVAYAVVAWLLIQAASIFFPAFDAPPWVMKAFIVVIILCFPIAIVLSWAFEITPEGIRRAEDVDLSKSITKKNGRKLIAITAVLAILAAGLFAFRLVQVKGRSRLEDRTVMTTDANILAGARPSIPQKSIAVLPFENRSEDKANAFFADGIQDEILTRLAKIGDLKVISRTSTLRYKSSPENLPAIAKQLGVAHVLEGSVQKAGDQVRVTVQLIRGETDSHVWAETYDRKLNDIFAVESEIAGSIARSLQAKLTPGEQQAVRAKPTGNPAAYEAYLRGLAIWNKLSSVPEDFEEMIKNLSQAVKLDPKFTLAWAFLSVAHSYEYEEFDPTPRRAAQAREALQQAQLLQPDLGEVYFADGMYSYKILTDYDAALAAFEKARERSANRSMAIEFSAYVKRRQGKWEDALRLHAESLEIDPRNPILLSEASLTYRALRRFQDAQSLLDRAREIAPDNAQLLLQQTELFLAQGDLESAGNLFGDIAIDGGDPIVTMGYVTFQSMSRHYAEVIQLLEGVLAKPEKLPPSFGAIATNYRAQLAIAHALAGNPEASTRLAQAREELTALHARGGETNWSAITLLLVAGFLKDAATVDAVAATLREKIAQDALAAPSLEKAIAIARAHLGQTEVAMKEIKHLLTAVGDLLLTPGLLRLDPLWDPLRSDPRFQELAAAR